MQFKYNVNHVLNKHLFLAKIYFLDTSLVLTMGRVASFMATLSVWEG